MLPKWIRDKYSNIESLDFLYTTTEFLDKFELKSESNIIWLARLIDKDTIFYNKIENKVYYSHADSFLIDYVNYLNKYLINYYSLDFLKLSIASSEIYIYWSSIEKDVLNEFEFYDLNEYDAFDLKKEEKLITLFDNMISINRDKKINNIL